MKTNLLQSVAFAMVMITLYNCSVEPTERFDQELLIAQELETVQYVSQQTLDEDPVCTGQIPKARLTNNGSIPFNFKIYGLDGTLLGFEDNVNPGSASQWLTFPEGQSLFVITNDDFFGEKISRVMSFCTEIALEVNSDNQFTNAQPQSISN